MSTSSSPLAGAIDPTQNYPASPDQGGPVPAPSQASDAAEPQSRLQAILHAVAKVTSAGLQGIPDKGRPSFVTGLGEGARSMQALKFKSFDDQVRLAQLHNQDIKMQNDTQAQQDAHKRAELDNRALAESLGINYDTIPSTGQAVMDHLTAQTAGGSAASVPAGTHLSGDGETVNIPRNDQATQDGQKQMYSKLAPVFGLPPLPPGRDFVPPQLMNMLTNKIHGYGQDGKPINHDQLPGVIASEQTQRDQLAQSGNASPDQLKALDNRIGILQANLDALDKHKTDVLKQNEQAKLDVTNNPDNQAAAARGAGLKKTAEEKAAFPYQLELAKQKAAQKNDSTELNAVAFDPNYQNPDGTKGANVVMSKADAQAKGLTHYKADPSTINTVVAGMNDVQNKLNQLADVVTDPKFAQVQPGVAAQMLAHGHGLTLDIGTEGKGASAGIGVDTSLINEKLYQQAVNAANPATRDYVTAMVGAHEAVTQLPRLQTFGKSNRMTEKQIEAAQNLLPQPGDGTMASQKMTSLQGMIDPLRKQIPHMPGAETTPSWLEKRQQQQRQNLSGGSNLGRAVSMRDATSIVNRLVPSN